MRPKLGILWDGDWPHPPQEGVGIELHGVPPDADKFIFTMAMHGCHPTAGAEICRLLVKGLYPRRTVMASLDFVKLNTDLLEHGVTLRIIPPWPYLRSSEMRGYGPWPEDIMKAVEEERKKR